MNLVKLGGGVNLVKLGGSVITVKEAREPQPRRDFLGALAADLAAARGDGSGFNR